MNPFYLHQYTAYSPAFEPLSIPDETVDTLPPESQTPTTSTNFGTFAWPLSSDQLMGSLIENGYITPGGQLNETLRNQALPPLNQSFVQHLAAFLHMTHTTELLRTITNEASKYALLLTEWNLGGNGLYILLNDSGYFHEAFESIGLTVQNRHWQERLSQDRDYNLTLFFKGAVLPDSSFLQESLKHLLNVSFVKTSYGLKGTFFINKQFPFVLHIVINSASTKLPTCDQLYLASSKINSDLSSPGNLRCREPSPWQALFDLALCVASPKRCSSLLPLIDLYTKGERTLDDHFEMRLVQDFRSMIRETQAPGIGTTVAFSNYLKMIRLTEPDATFLLALQLMLTANLTDETCKTFLSEIEIPLQLHLLKNPLLQEIHYLLNKKLVPFSAIHALLIISGFCQLHSYEQDSFLQFSATKAKTSWAMRISFPNSTKTLLLSCDLTRAIKTITSHLSAPDQSTLLISIYSKLFLAAPVVSSIETQDDIALPLTDYERQELTVLVERLIESESFLLAHLGLLLSTILPLYSSRRYDNTITIPATLRALSCFVPLTTHIQLIQSIQGSVVNTAPYLFQGLHTILSNQPLSISDWRRHIVTLLLNDPAPQVRLCSYPILSTMIQNGENFSIELGTRLLPELIKAKMLYRVTVLIKLLTSADLASELQSKPPLQFDLACLQQACSLARSLLNNGGAACAGELEPTSKIIILVLQKSHLHEQNKQISQTIHQLIIALLDQKYTLLASDLFMHAVQASALAQQSNNKLDQLSLSLCQEILETDAATSAALTFKFASRHGLCKASHHTLPFLLKLLHKLLETTHSAKEDIWSPSAQTEAFANDPKLTSHIENSIIEIVHAMNGQSIVEFLPDIAGFQSSSELHTVTLAACQKLPKESQKKAAKYLHTLRKNAKPPQSTDIWLIKLFANTKNAEYLPMAMQLFKNTLAETFNLQDCAYLFEGLIEAANAHPSLEPQLLTLVRSSLPLLIDHLNFKTCSQKLLQIQSHERTELVATYVLEKIGQKKLRRNEAEELVNIFKTLNESVVFIDHFRILEKSLLHPHFIEALGDTLKYDLICSFFETLLERGLSYQISRDQRLYTFTSFIQNHERIPKSHPTFRICLLQSIQIIFKLFQEEGDALQFSVRLTSCLETISISQKKKSGKKSDRTKICIKLRAELNNFLLKAGADVAFPLEIRQQCTMVADERL